MGARLNFGCGPHYAAGWLNVDLIREPSLGIEPDEIVARTEPLPYPDGHFERVYAGHVIEHLQWRTVPDVIEDLMRVLHPDGKLLIVGPDIYRAIAQWKTGEGSWATIEATLEDDRVFMSEGEWDGARHKWNCHEERVLRLMDDLGYTAEGVPITDRHRFNGWPVVSSVKWQFAVEVTKA